METAKAKVVGAGGDAHLSQFQFVLEADYAAPLFVLQRRTGQSLAERRSYKLPIHDAPFAQANHGNEIVWKALNASSPRTSSEKEVPILPCGR